MKNKNQVWAKNLKDNNFKWYGDDESITLEQFADALNRLPYHYWVRVHNDVVDKCQNLIMVMDYEGREMLTGEGEKNFDSLFGDHVFSVPIEDRSDEVELGTECVCWSEAEEYIW